jgi:glycine/D-amino acid oxidase-like deaminating enzyme
LYLQERILALGGTIERGTVPSLKALAQIPHHNNKNADIIVNCSALGSRNLGGVHDHHMFPTRGQIEIVRVPDELWSKAKDFTMLKEGGGLTYVIPRENGEIILGGTQQQWN